MKALAAAIAVLALSGCGEAARSAQPTEPASTAYSAHGLTAALPPGWQHATTRLTTITEPVDVLSVGTFPLRYRPVGCNHMPSSALLDLGPDDALVTIFERANGSVAGFPPRPEHFGPTPQDGSEAPECVPPARFTDHWFTFSDAGRYFHVLVAFGPSTSAKTQAQAWGILDGLRVGRG
ncbi:MAG: hypothetical protein QOJ57_686 [Thermoleophilaceae bacterium]|nr:hypothetical protein [Thermoleophilaceae bacterium]